MKAPCQPVLKSQSVPILKVDGLVFKDLNRTGVLEPYEDWRLPAEVRAKDLVSRMTLEEKSGAMMHANPPTTGSSQIPGAGTAWDIDGIKHLLLDQHITFFLNRLNSDVVSLASQQNALQAIAESGRLGIPVTLSTDPRSQFGHVQGVSVSAGDFTKWPDPAGFGAIGDPELVRKFADSVRQEYMAVGIRIALSPQADLAMNPRWHRDNGTFGSDPETVARMVNAYVSGMQNGDRGIEAGSVVSVVKHWVGYGATEPDGFDAHNYYGRHLNLASADVERHILPFTGAFAAEVGTVMPSYGQPLADLMVLGSSKPIEQVGMGFNRQMLSEVLRGRFKFTGVIMSDWQIMDDCTQICMNGAKPGEKPGAGDIAMPWGVENLSKEDRFAKALRAGIDQFGGAKDPSIIIDLVKTGRISIDMVNASVLRIMTQKFQQGLFENPYVDVEKAKVIVGNAAFKKMSFDAQRRSIVLLENQRATLPLRPEVPKKVYLYGFDADVARRHGLQVVPRVEDADLAIVAMSTPFERLHPNYFFGSRYREGSTAFHDGDPDFEEFKRISSSVPTVVSLYLERPADLTRLAKSADAVLGNFGASPDAIFDVVTGVTAPFAKLPFELPWSAGESQETSVHVAHHFGDGLTY
jgi:beta-glucosidase